MTALIPLQEARANWASRFSIATGEQYSDNIFFSQNKENDFVTFLAPTLGLAYKPSGHPEPTFMVGLSSSAEIFSQHSELNNIGDNLKVNANSAYHYSPRLNFTLTEYLLRRGESRTSRFGNSGRQGGSEGLGGFGGGGMLGERSVLGGVSGLGGTGGFGGGGGGSSCRGVGGSGDGGENTGLEGDLIVRGERLENRTSGDADFQYSPNLQFKGGYCWGTVWFISRGGKETAHSVNIEGIYKRWRQHNLRARYNIRLLQSRDGGNDIVHDFDLGDSFISEHEIRITPTLTAEAAVGISVSTSKQQKLRLHPKLDLEMTKVWRTAQLTTGMHSGLTGSFGVSGPSLTTTFPTQFTVQLSQRLVGAVGAELTLFDAERADFKTFQAFLGFQYWVAGWLSTNIIYSYNWAKQSGGALARNALGRGKVESNGVFLFMAVHFDIWPHFSLVRDKANSMIRSRSSPLGSRTP